MMNGGNHRARAFIALTSGLLLSACASARSGGDAPGALIRMEMPSKVGVLLDEIPEGPLRDAAAAEVASRGADFWTRHAKRQVRLMYYRLVYRGGFYPADPPRGPLPLPAQDALWNIHLGAPPHRETKDGHDAVVMDYRFETHLLTPTDAPGSVEPALAKVGGTFLEAFAFPLDPDLLLERTGYACMDEDQYPPFSVFEENTAYFYDDTCDVETAANALCHVTSFPVESCVDALAAHTGLVQTDLRLSRVPYSKALADRVRTGKRTSESTAAFSVVVSDLEQEHAIFYRFFSPSSCEAQEGVIGSPGWRRLLAFSASIQNDGGATLDMGNVADPSNPWLQSHVFEYNDCHHHYHFSHYGDFSYGDAPGAKRAFCLEDSNRYHNDEQTPLLPEHQSCVLQGVTAGWGDEYQFGIPGQWVDITGADTTQGHQLTFNFNADHFMCEGTPETDTDGTPVFEPTSFTDSAGEVVSRQACSLLPDWQSDNRGSTLIQSDGGSFVTEPCARGQMGPLRSCGFDLDATLLDCDPAGSVTLHCTSAGSPQVVRVCERSEVLASGVACTVREAAANAIVMADGTDLAFACPAVRDAASPGAGGFAIYRAPVIPGQAISTVTCALQ